MSNNPRLTQIIKTNGKTTPNGATTYEYGTLGELKKVTTPIKTIEYLHNANNQRVPKKVDWVIVEKYLWANLTTLLAVYDANDTLVQRFEYANGRMPIAMTQNGSKYYLHYDQLGSLRAISDSSHNIIKEVVYDSYGNILSDSNLYGYVLGDPVDFVDPYGLVDINLIPTNEIMHERANNVNYNNIFTIASHGYGGLLTSLGILTLEDVAKKAKASGKSEILLIACNQ